VATFPLSLSANWLSALQTDDLTPTEREWLFEPRSLTAKLKSKATSFSVKVLSEQTFNLNHEQQQLLDCKTSSALNREVLLLCDNHPMVYAQSWLPNNQTHNSLHNMGERPLGDVIFQQPELVRQNIEIARFDNNHSIQNLVAQQNLPIQTLLGRRSVFSLSEYQFLVAEVFLPGAYLYL
jgi:chorismate--pyruvate lyase